METYISDRSGINSLGGFAYQIKAFVLYMLSIDEDMQVGFEIIDDVSVKKIAPDTIDNNEDKFRDLVRSPVGIKAIQVKRTVITREVAKQILLNWILLESSNEKITDYIVFTDSSYENSDIIFNISKEDLYTDVLSTKSSKSTIAKVKKKYKNEKQRFMDIYESMKSKYSFRVINNIDNEIDEKCKLILKEAGVTSITYYNRIEELLRHITFEIKKKLMKNTLL